MSEQLLQGIRVVDFTGFLAGPYGSMYLADMGAEVIKVENISTNGEFVRNAMPKEPKTGRSMYFQNLNRNKKAVALDLKSYEGKQLFAELVKSADVLIENNRPGVMKRLGFDYESCKKLNSKLIYASVSGFGQTGPYFNRPGYDLIGQAMGGSMSITGLPGQEPTRAGMAISDMMSGLNASIGILAALYGRNKSGHGERIDVALLDSMVSALEAKMMQYIYTGKSPVMTGNRYLAAAPYDSFKAKDGYFVIASGTSAHFVKFATCIGRPELINDPLYCGTEERKQNWESLKNIIEEWAGDKSYMDCVNIIVDVGVPAGPIYDCEAIFKDPHIHDARQMFVEIEHPEAGPLIVLANPIHFTECPCEYHKTAPDLGENNDEIFEALGFSKEQLSEYKEKKVLN